MKKMENRIPGVIGIVGTLISLNLFGADNLVIPAMIIILLILLLARRKLESVDEEEERKGEVLLFPEKKEPPKMDLSWKCTAGCNFRNSNIT